MDKTEIQNRIGQLRNELRGLEQELKRIQGEEDHELYTSVVAGTYKCKLTAEDWQLFTVSMDCTEAVTALNKTLEACINNHSPIYRIKEIMADVMNTYSNFGASDTEPRGVLLDELERCLGVSL